MLSRVFHTSPASLVPSPPSLPLVASSREYHAVPRGRYLSRVSLAVQKVRGMGPAHPRFVPVFGPAPQSRPAPHFVPTPDEWVQKPSPKISYVTGLSPCSKNLPVLASALLTPIPFKNVFIMLSACTVGTVTFIALYYTFKLLIVAEKWCQKTRLLNVAQLAIV